jgi:xanthine dehydrogenase accessory factor
MLRRHLETIAADVQTRRPVVLATWLASGKERLIHAGEEEGELATAVAEGLRADRSGIIRIDGEEVFLNVYNPPLRMVMIGAVHISQSLIPMAEAAGYQVTVIDPRTAFATPERFGGVSLIPEWPDEALPSIGLDARTAFIALTHDPKIDDPALRIALAASPFYIGALGSSRTHKTRLERLSAAGVAPEALARIHAPIGLDIGAIGAPEIAISIMAEVTATLRGKGGKR